MLRCRFRKVELTVRVAKLAESGGGLQQVW